MLTAVTCLTHLASLLWLTAPCSVGIQRGRILYKGKRLWIEELDPNRVLHRDIVSVYCMNEARKCGYAMPTQCIDGRLDIPGCYDGKHYIQTGCFRFIVALLDILMWSLVIHFKRWEHRIQNLPLDQSKALLQLKVCFMRSSDDETPQTLNKWHDQSIQCFTQSLVSVLISHHSCIFSPCAV